MFETIFYIRNVKS